VEIAIEAIEGLTERFVQAATEAQNALANLNA
jgi:hypothetical protein